MLKTLVEKIAYDVANKTVQNISKLEHKANHGSKSNGGYLRKQKNFYDITWLYMQNVPENKRRARIKFINQRLRDYICIELIQFAVNCAQRCFVDSERRRLDLEFRTRQSSTHGMNPVIRRPRRRLGFSMDHIEKTLQYFRTCTRISDAHSSIHAIADAIPNIHVQQTLQYIFAVAKTTHSTSAREPSWRLMSRIPRSTIIDILLRECDVPCETNEFSLLESASPLDENPKKKKNAIMRESFRSGCVSLLTGAKYFIASRIRDSLQTSLLKINEESENEEPRSRTLLLRIHGDSPESLHAEFCVSVS